jgi:hypothetical protein
MCCEHCGELAVYDVGDTLVKFSTLLGAGGHSSPRKDSTPGPFVSITGFIGHITSWGHSARLPEIKAAIEASDLDRLCEIDHLLVPFYCLQCRCCYCIRHWSVFSSFDPDGGSHESTRGTCPEGHSRLLDD